VNYREATDMLFERITANDLAEELGASQNSVARARLDLGSRDYRPPPMGWPAAVARLAAKRAARLLDLCEKLQDDPSK
jgi:hypothetical protein